MASYYMPKEQDGIYTTHCGIPSVLSKSLKYQTAKTNCSTLSYLTFIPGPITGWVKLDV